MLVFSHTLYIYRHLIFYHLGWRKLEARKAVQTLAIASYYKIRTCLYVRM